MFRETRKRRKLKMKATNGNDITKGDESAPVEYTSGCTSVFVIYEVVAPGERELCDHKS